MGIGYTSLNLPPPPHDDFTIASSFFGDVNVSGCPSVNHLGLSAGFRDRVFFASDCLFGEFDFALGDAGRVLWSERNYQITYAAFPPAIDYHGRGHFLVRSGAHIQVLRSYVSGKYETLASFNDFLPPETDASLASYPFSGLSVMADGTVLFGGGNKLKRLAKDMIFNLNLGDNQLWGHYGSISSYDAIYVAEVDSATHSSLNIRQIPFNRSDRTGGAHHSQTELNANSRIHPVSLGLVNDGSGNKVVYIANGELFAQDTDNLNNSPQQLDILPATSGSSSQNLANPPALLLAGKEAYIKGRKVSGIETYDQLYRMVFTSGKSAPFSRNIRGVWAQPGADQQGSYGVPAGVEVLLDQSVSRAALSCHLMDDEENSFIVPEGGVFLRNRSKLLSIYHHELTANHLMQLQAGVECQPYQVELVPQKFKSVSDDGVVGLVLGATNALGDSFQLQLVARQTLIGAGSESVPLWATNQTQINGALSSEVTVTTKGCVNQKSSCSGYRRLAIGGDSEQQMTDNKSRTIVVTAVLGTGLTLLLVTLGVTVWNKIQSYQVKK